MKQTITAKQLDELSEKGKERFMEMILPNAKSWDEVTSNYSMPDDSPLLSIGQMIEFLSDKDNVDHPITIHERFLDWKVVSRDGGKIYSKGIELADALWEACREILNE